MPGSRAAVTADGFGGLPDESPAAEGAVALSIEGAVALSIEDGTRSIDVVS
ncbi:hypothetical protein [Plantactinospora sp. BB1]|uniref:hypothetical protein n=1 Tax=Plantactinospora sp. BB1 TaxID=2071627 RepID=UPI001F1584F5|nr:hypothetical protein [Plantactinospora sp. BB1]